MAKSSPKPTSYLLQPPLWPDLVASALQARATTSAPGAAIALTNESADEIICHARSGTMAPELGTALLIEGSLTAQCVRSGKQLYCHDAKVDTRICSSAATELAARSLVVTPIQQGNQAIGVLAVFSNAPDAFSPAHLIKLKTIADQVAVILRDQQDPEVGQLQLLKNTSDALQPDVGKPKPPLSAQLPLPGKESREEPLPPVQIVPAIIPAIEYSAERLPAAPVPIAHTFTALNAVSSQKKEPAIAHRILAVAVGLLVIAGSATWASLKRAGPSPVDATSVQTQPVQQAEIAPQSAEPASPTDTSAQPVRLTEQQPNSDAATGLLRKAEFPRKHTEIARGNATFEPSVAGPARSANPVSLAAVKEPAPLTAADGASPAPASNVLRPWQSVSVVG